MKRYLFGLGAMLVGAGLMFVLTYGEVSASKNVSGLVSIINNLHTPTSGSVKNCLNHSYFIKPIARSRNIQI